MNTRIESGMRLFIGPRLTSLLEETQRSKPEETSIVRTFENYPLGDHHVVSQDYEKFVLGTRKATQSYM